MRICDMQEEAYQTAKDHGFHDVDACFSEEDQLNNIATKLMLIVSEASEALEDLRNGHTKMTFSLVDGKPCGLPSELADIIIRTGDLAEMLDIDLQHAVKLKMAYNKSRPRKHGKKF